MYSKLKTPTTVTARYRRPARRAFPLNELMCLSLRQFGEAAAVDEQRGAGDEPRFV
jgi:hypothetical protein